MHTSEWRVEPGSMTTWTKVMRGGLTADDGLEIVAKTYAIEGHTATDVARLIAAAPELLSRLQAAAEFIAGHNECLSRPVTGGDTQWNDYCIGLLEDCKSAIAKAEGRDE